MKKSMKNLCLATVAGALLGVAIPARAATVTVDPNDAWIGYMNVFELPQNGGAYLWGSPWGTADLTAVWSGPVLTLGTNNINDPNPYWYTPGGGPGAQGNKIMDANMYVQTVDGTYTGQTLTFQGVVTSNTLFGKQDSLGNTWTSVAFIKEFASDYSSFTSVTVPLNPGAFSISLPLSNDPTRHVQYGFETIGSCVWITDAPLFGNIQVQAVPEPGTFLAVGAGIAILAKRRRSKK